MRERGTHYDMVIRQMELLMEAAEKVR